MPPSPTYGSPSRSKKTSPGLGRGQPRVARGRARAAGGGASARRSSRDSTCSAAWWRSSVEALGPERPRDRCLAAPARARARSASPSSTRRSRWSRRAPATRLRWSSATPARAALAARARRSRSARPARGTSSRRLAATIASSRRDDVAVQRARSGAARSRPSTPSPRTTCASAGLEALDRRRAAGCRG